MEPYRVVVRVVKPADVSSVAIGRLFWYVARLFGVLKPLPALLTKFPRRSPPRQTVVIVDTSSEIAGDGDIPHLQAIGQSRRMMVPNKREQHRCSGTE